MATSVSKRSRAFCYTLFNYDDSTVAKLKELKSEYHIIGFEVCPTTGKKHLQGFVYFANARSTSALKKIANSIHIEMMKGTPKQASEYCKYDDYPANTKLNEFWEEGQVPTQGSRTDWAEVRDALKTTDVISVIDSYPQTLPAIRTLERYKALLLKPCHRDVTVIVRWGGAGVGKTRWAYDTYPDLYSKPRGEWWDGYTGQKTVLLDDYYGYLPYSELLRVLDRYPYQVPVKGGFVQAQWDTVIITSNKAPEHWYAQGLTDALRRRFKEVIHCQ